MPGGTPLLGREAPWPWRRFYPGGEPEGTAGPDRSQDRSSHDGRQDRGDFASAFTAPTVGARVAGVRLEAHRELGHVAQLDGLGQLQVDEAIPAHRDGAAVLRPSAFAVRGRPEDVRAAGRRARAAASG